MRKFKKMDQKKKTILIEGISIILLITIVFLYRSYAIYQESHDFNVIKGSAPESINPYDVKLSVTIDGNESNTFPDANSGKAVSSILCTKGAEGSWDYKNWLIQVKNVKEARTKCQVKFVSKYTDSVLNGADPIINDELVPVTIDNHGVVRKANESTEWYNYTNKVWANAIILEDRNVVYQNDEVIPEENIESYFVWIPRYKYKIFNEGNYSSLTSIEKREKTIEIAFENRNQAASQGSRVGEWLSHPAFTSFNTNGMWVGKFETGYQGANSKEASQNNGAYASRVQIKPNVYSWRNIQVANAFIVSYEYQRDMDSHMMKNTEWGAVAYLSHSAYGIQASVRNNNNSSYTTGYAAVNEPTCGYTNANEECNKYESINPGKDGTYTVNYKNAQSVLASTTGNYSGIYDMSGGAWEYVMGVMMDSNGNMVSGRNDVFNSNFIGTLTYPGDGSNKTKTVWTASDGGIPFPDAKYYDKYVYEEEHFYYNRRILGDATGEMGPFANVVYSSQTRQLGSWYNDEAWFVSHGYPWFVRGNDLMLGNGTGIFAFNYANGQANTRVGFRIVLSI